MKTVVKEEAQTAISQGDVIVLTSGPNEMADDVQAAVIAANLTTSHSGRGRICLVDETLSW